jgi:hypothetical protein
VSKVLGIGYGERDLVHAPFYDTYMDEVALDRVVQQLDGTCPLTPCEAVEAGHRLLARYNRGEVTMGLLNTQFGMSHEGLLGRMQGDEKRWRVRLG